MGQLDAVILDGDDMTAVEVADTPLESFLAHSEDLFDGLGVSLVAVGAFSPVGDEVVGEFIGEVDGLLMA